jgi:hypothetical protein
MGCGVTSLRERAMREPLRKYQFRLWMLLAIITLLCVLFGVVTRWPIVAWAGAIVVAPSFYCIGLARVVRENSITGKLVGVGLMLLGALILFWFCRAYFDEI